MNSKLTQKVLREHEGFLLRNKRIGGNYKREKMWLTSSLFVNNVVHKRLLRNGINTRIKRR